MNPRGARTFLELRRLAAQALRFPESREVLHDALLDTLPRQYLREIEAAEFASSQGIPSNVWFFPHLLNRTTRRYGTEYLAFERHPAYFRRQDFRLGRVPEDARRAVIVYRAA